MAYKKTNWQDTLRDAQGNVIQKGTPLNAQALGKIEDGIVGAEQKIDNEISQVAQQLAQKAGHSELNQLQTQIDNFQIEQSSGMTDTGSLELVAARTNVEGTSFPTAKRRIDNIENALLSQKYEIILGWELGGLSNGVPINSGTRLRTKEFFATDKNLTVQVGSDYEFSYVLYNKSGNQHTQSAYLSVSPINIAPNDPNFPNYKFIIRRKDGGQITPSEANAIRFYYNESNKHVNTKLAESGYLTQNKSVFEIGTGKTMEGKNVDLTKNVVEAGTVDLLFEGKTLEYTHGYAATFKDKVKDSLANNVNYSKNATSNELLMPDAFVSQIATSDYVKISELDGITHTTVATTNGGIPQQIFAFDVVKSYEKRYGRIPIESTALADKILWLRKNCADSMVQCFWTGYGENSNGKKAYFKQFQTTRWAGDTSTTQGSPATLRRDVGISQLQADGFMYFLAHGEASDGIAPSYLHTDYIYFEFELKPNYVSVGQGNKTVGYNENRITVVSKKANGSQLGQYFINLSKPLKSINGNVFDELLIDKYGIPHLTRNVSDWVELTGAMTWEIDEVLEKAKRVKLPISYLVNSVKNSTNLKLIKHNGVQVPSAVGVKQESTYLSSSHLMVVVNDVDSGWPMGYQPTPSEVQAYFYGYRMCNADNSTPWNGVETKHWTKIYNVGQSTNTLPTSQADYYFTPYRVMYQLATTETLVNSITAPKIAFENGGTIEVDAGSVTPIMRYQVELKGGNLLGVISEYNPNAVGLVAHRFSGYLSEKREQIGVKVVPNDTVSGLPETTVTVTPSIQYQEFLGAGAALTEASAWLLWTKMTKSQRQSLLKELFSPDQGALKAIRICMGTSDFRIGSVYSYDDTGGTPDYNMANFSIGEGTPGTAEATKDLAFIVPIIQEILAINPDVKVIAAPWYLPDWMGHPFNYNESTAKALALYFVKFIRAYKKYGIPIHAVSPINEPELTFSGQWSASGISDFTINYLSPMLFNHEPSTKIMGFDANYDAKEFFDIINDESAPYHDAIALHTYRLDISYIQKMLKKYKELDFYITERRTMLNDPVWLQSRIMLGEIAVAGLQHGVSLVTIWNLALDEKGTPNYGGTPGRRGAITVQSDGTGNVTRNLDYYMLRAISQNVRAGARRIESTNYNPLGQKTDIGSVAFLNTDESISVLIANQDYGVRTVNVRLLGKTYQVAVPPYGYVQLDLGSKVNESQPLKDGVLPTV